MNQGKPVLQQWVIDHCSWREQTVLLTGIRGPDQPERDPAFKPWVRWIRQTVLNDARSGENFMKVDHERVAIMEMYNKNKAVIDGMTVHYLSHFMHVLEVIAYRHPDSNTALTALMAYRALVSILHLNEETVEQMTERLKDGK